MAEQARGRQATAAATAWGLADLTEKQIRLKWPGCTISVQVIVDNPSGLELQVRTWDRNKRNFVSTLTAEFPPEPVGTFPSETLMAQLALLLG